MERCYETLAKLKQQTIVSTRLAKFEGLQAIIETLPLRFLLDRFIGGLKKEIKYDVLTSRPVDFRDAISLAKFFKGVLSRTKKGGKATRPYSSSKNNNQLVPYSKNPNSNTKPEDWGTTNLRSLAKSKGLIPS